MAIYHLTAKIIGRKAGQSAVACASYRSGQELHDERNGSSYSFRRAERVEHSEIIAPGDAPEWATDRAKLWNSVEAGERRKDAQLAREFELSLPRELTLEQQRELIREWVAAEITPAGAVADFSIHNDRAGKQPHCHIMTTLRSLSAEGWSKQKLRQWEDRSALAQWRSSWAEHANRALERAGSEARIDHRSYADQDAHLPEELRREPTRKVGPWARGGDRERENQSIIALNISKLRRVAERVRASKPEPVAQAPAPVAAPAKLGLFARFNAALANRKRRSMERAADREAAREAARERYLAKWETALKADRHLQGGLGVWNEEGWRNAAQEIGVPPPSIEDQKLISEISARVSKESYEQDLRYRREQADLRAALDKRWREEREKAAAQPPSRPSPSRGDAPHWTPPRGRDNGR